MNELRFITMPVYTYDQNVCADMVDLLHQLARYTSRATRFLENVCECCEAVHEFDVRVLDGVFVQYLCSWYNAVYYC